MDFILFYFFRKAERMVIILSFNSVFVAGGPKNKHTDIHIHKEKFFPLGKQ